MNSVLFALLITAVVEVFSGKPLEVILVDLVNKIGALGVSVDLGEVKKFIQHMYDWMQSHPASDQPTTLDQIRAAAGALLPQDVQHSEKPDTFPSDAPALKE